MARKYENQPASRKEKVAFGIAAAIMVAEPVVAQLQHTEHAQHEVAKYEIGYDLETLAGLGTVAVGKRMMDAVRTPHEQANHQTYRVPGQTEKQ